MVAMVEMGELLDLHGASVVETSAIGGEGKQSAEIVVLGQLVSPKAKETNKI
jgi:hypothetical protein